MSLPPRIYGPGANEPDFEALAFLERSRDVADEVVARPEPAPRDQTHEADPTGGTLT